VQGVGGVLAWLVNTAVSAVIGLVVGAVVVAIMHVLPFRRRDNHGSAGTETPH
jgi:predicted DNA repair protein MutK